jgi:hypothetical protein
MISEIMLHDSKISAMSQMSITTAIERQMTGKRRPNDSKKTEKNRGDSKNNDQTIFTQKDK